jgi:hypothetical protein
LFYLTLFFLLLRIGYEVKWRVWIKLLLIFFLTADLFGNMGFYGKEKTSEYFKKTKILESISSDRDEFRVFSTPKTISMDTPILISEPSPLKVLKEKHLPPLNLLHSLRDIWGIDVIRLKRTEALYRALTEAASISSTPLMELYGVKYVISVTLIKDPSLELIESMTQGLPGQKEDLLKENTIKFYKNLNPSQRGWLVKGFRVMDPEAILSTIKSNGVHIKEEVLLEEEPNAYPLKNIESRQKSVAQLEKVKWVSESNNRLSLLVNAEEDSILFLNDTYFIGWKAFVDGERRRILRANYNFRAVPLPAGSHQVEFVYDPLSFKLGAWITSLGVAGCLGMGVFRRMRRGKA